MISPETLRRYRYFGLFNEEQLKALAILAEPVAWQADEVVFHEGQLAEGLYLLTEGAIDLIERSEDLHDSSLRKEFAVGEINPGEIFGISAMIPPFKLTASAVASRASEGIRFDAPKLYHLCQVEMDLENRLLRQLTKAIFERLQFIRVQLAAATAA